MLLPRGKSSVNVASKSLKKKRSSYSESSPKKLLGELHGNKELEKQRIDLMETEEWDFITELRKKNERKQNLQDESKILYCHCQQPSSGYMVQCDLCLDWYHDSCLDSESEKPDANAKYLCSLCKRSNRPNLLTAKCLLASLQALQVNLTEGTALECLLTRAAKWQKKAREAIARTREVFAQQQTIKKQQEVKAAIGKLQNVSELVLLNKTQPKQGAPASDNPSICASQSNNTTAKSTQSLVSIAPKPPVVPCVAGTSGVSVTVGSILQKNFPAIGLNSGLSKSTSHVQAIVSALLAVNKNGNNNNGMVSKRSELPCELRKELEEVMLRCDLLEVTFEEEQQLWQILHEDEILRNNDIQSTNQVS